MAKHHCNDHDRTIGLPFEPELVIDNFAGGGGASTGIELGFRALGVEREVTVAINHDSEALAMHAANHPGTKHFSEDVFEIHPGFVTQQQPIGLAWFSPDCKHHSKAKGGKPREQKIRGLAWVALKWAALQRPRVIILENVEEFRDWGPLDDHGQPIATAKGRTFKAFADALSTGLPPDHPDLEEICATLGASVSDDRLIRGLGYAIEWKTLTACDYATPTKRKRLFVIARCDGLPIVWPKPTHGPRESAAVKSGKLQPWRSAAECIEWSIPCPSIFTRKRPLAAATLRRIARGLQKFVIDSGDPFIVKFRYDSSGNSVHDPLPTITAGSYVTRPGGAAHALGLCTPTLVQIGYGERTGQPPRCLDIAAPLGTIVAGGGKHALVCAFLAQHNKARKGVNPGRAATEPLSTVTARGSQQTVIASYLVKLRGDNVGSFVQDPLPTISAGGMHHAEVRALLENYGSQDHGSTITDGELDVGVVLIGGQRYMIVDIGLRMLTPRELARAQGFPDDYLLNPSHNGKPLTQSAQVRMIGNSVCPQVAAAIVAANFAHERQFLAHAA